MMRTAPDTRIGTIAASLLVAMLIAPNLAWICVARNATSVNGLAIAIWVLTLFFIVFSKRLWVACLILSPFVLLAPIEVLYITVYHNPSNSQALATVVATTPTETLDFLGPAKPFVALLALFALAITFAAIYFNRRSPPFILPGVKEKLLASTLMAAIVGIAVIFLVSRQPSSDAAQKFVSTMGDQEDIFKNTYPFGVFMRIADYYKEWSDMRTYASQIGHRPFHAEHVRYTGRRQIYVLVIGESSNRSHWQLFGYDRTTTPNLAQAQNLVPITNMMASWSATIMAVPIMITRKPMDDGAIAWKEGSILRAMREAGFNTYWISNQFMIGKFDSPVAIYSYEADHVLYLNHASMSSPGAYDQVLIGALSKAIQTTHGDLFVVLHTMGSHIAYDSRYPPSFAQFKPTLSDESSSVSELERTRNSYDNTILYTDHVLAEVIDVLDQTHDIAAMFYESDHGENLPTSTCSLKGHGHFTPSDFQIPALFWYSDAYQEAFPTKVAEIRSHAGQAAVSEDTFASLLDMTGTSIPGQDWTWSLFNPSWRYHSRHVHDLERGTVADIDHATFGKQCHTIISTDAF